MEVLKDAYRDIKKMFVVLGHKNAATSVKIFSLAAIIFSYICFITCFNQFFINI